MIQYSVSGTVSHVNEGVKALFTFHFMNLLHICSTPCRIAGVTGKVYHTVCLHAHGHSLIMTSFSLSELTCIEAEEQLSLQCKAG